jgi:hypothetical protein
MPHSLSKFDNNLYDIKAVHASTFQIAPPDKLSTSRHQALLCTESITQYRKSCAPGERLSIFFLRQDLGDIITQGGDSRRRLEPCNAQMHYT